MSNQDNMDQFPRKFGNYHLLKPLAQGGMGALYLAVRGDRGLERLLVIKTVLPHLADAEYTQRFRDEAKVVVKLSHGNLIPVFDAGSVDGELYLAMEFVEGRDLRAIWNRCAKKQVAFPVDVAVYIIKELCRGLSYAHAFGDLKLVHRDISPPNILVSYAGEVKITDFGLASSKLKLEKTAPGIIYGKVAYMSPEQARGEPLDGRSDLYASAIVLWELLTGRQLFPPGKDQPQDLLHRARNPMPTSPSKKAPRVPPALDEICLRALAPLREDRYPSGDEFRKALSAYLISESPATDAHRLELFLYDLFAEDIARDRTEREELLDSIRKRARTLPPTDELRQMIERSRPHEQDTEATPMDPAMMAEAQQAGQNPAGGHVGTIDPSLDEAVLDSKIKRAENSVGRRARDHGQPGNDRRQVDDRRRNGSDDPAEEPAPGGQGGQGGQALLGQVVDNRYRIREIIGEGGMGRVYLAEHIELDRKVAMKILHPVYGRMPELVERFRREARAASKIGNPHIVDVTDFGRTPDGSTFFVMEYLAGRDLGSLIEEHGAIDIRRALRVGVQICQALSAAHAAGIIHRDLKPDNIFLAEHNGENDFVKVLDFGVARSVEIDQARKRKLTSPGMAMGTPEYMAPEQAAGRPADSRCDIYSVGAILYEALTGIVPYEGDNFMEVLTKKATTELPSAHKLRREVPIELSQLVERSMARDPAERPASMEALEYELEKCLSGRPIAVANAIGLRADPSMHAGHAGQAGHAGSAAAMGRPGSHPGARLGSDQGHSAPPEPSVHAGLVASAAGSVDYGVPGQLDSIDHTDNVRKIGLPRWVVAGGVAVAILLLIGVGTLIIIASNNGERVVTPGKLDGGAIAQPVQQPDAGTAVAVATPDAAPTVAQKKPDAGTTVAGDGTPDAGERPTRLSPRQMLKQARRLARRNWREAKKLYEQVLDDTRDKRLVRDAHIGLARIAMDKERNYARAIKHSEDAVTNGGGESAQYTLARANRLAGNESLALRQYKKLIKLFGSSRRHSQYVREASQLCIRLGEPCDFPSGG